MPCWTSQGETVASAEVAKQEEKVPIAKFRRRQVRGSLVIYWEGDVVGDSGVTLMAGEMKQVASVSLLTGTPAEGSEGIRKD